MYTIVNHVSLSTVNHLHSAIIVNRLSCQSSSNFNHCQFSFIVYRQLSIIVNRQLLIIINRQSTSIVKLRRSSLVVNHQSSFIANHRKLLIANHRQWPIIAIPQSLSITVNCQSIIIVKCQSSTIVNHHQLILVINRETSSFVSRQSSSVGDNRTNWYELWRFRMLRTVWTKILHEIHAMVDRSPASKGLFFIFKLWFGYYYYENSFEHLKWCWRPSRIENYSSNMLI